MHRSALPPLALAWAASWALPALAQPVRACEPASADGPSAVALALQDAVLGAARAGGALEARAERLAPAVRAAFDLDGAAYTVAGELWEDAPAEGREALARALERLAATSLAARVPPNEATAERSAETTVEPLSFAPLEVREEHAASARVTGAVLEDGEPATTLEYLLTRAGERWRVRDVLVDGKSGLERLASELVPAREGGLAALTAAVEQRASRFGMSPGEVAARLQEALLAAMQAGAEAGYAGRLERLGPVIEETHDLAAMARLSVGRTWSKLSAAERRRFTDAFRDMSLAAYAANFETWNGERFAVDQAQELERAVFVQSRLIKKDGKAVSFQYLVSRRGGLWRIVNVIVDGVSDLALKRTEYSRLYEKSGFEALVAKVRAETARYEAGGRDE